MFLMIHRSSVQSRRGFSLIELMVVVGIMILLAGLVIAALPGVESRINRNKTLTYIAELGNGIDRYELDNGIFPLNVPSSDDPTTRDQEGLEGGNVLYTHLSGDFDEDGSPDEGATVYVPSLDYDSNEDRKEKRSDKVISGSGTYTLIDAYNNEVRYLAHKPNTEDKKTKHPSYDIWSIFDTSPSSAGSAKAQAAYITNWTN
ncbi:MAG: prepilin-type N-terminal cleavage/methylation domain-containing protein [Verrucomicrobiota bacterium]